MPPDGVQGGSRQRPVVPLRFSCAENGGVNLAERFGANVRDLRLKRAWKQSDLAQRVTELGVPLALNLISRIEKGVRMPDLAEVVALALALGVTPNRLMLTGDATYESIEL